MIVYILKYLLAVLMLDDDILISFPDSQLCVLRLEGN